MESEFFFFVALCYRIRQQKQWRKKKHMIKISLKSKIYEFMLRSKLQQKKDSTNLFTV